MVEKRDGVINGGDGSVGLEDGVVEGTITWGLHCGCYEGIEDFYGFR